MTPLRFGIIFAGGFLGAGFLSGREIWQYFLRYGIKGYIGFALAVVLIAFLGFTGVGMGKELQLKTGEELFLLGEYSLLRHLLTIVQTFTLFTIVSAMTAGIAALLEQLTGWNYMLSSASISILLLLISFAGLHGVASVFSMTVPILTGLTVLFGILSLFQKQELDTTVLESTSLVLNNWAASAVIFACYNLYGVLVRVFYFGKELKTSKEIRRGTIIGTCLLLIVAVCDMLAIGRFPKSTGFELPMLYVAGEFGHVMKLIYALLLFLGMFGTAQSSLVGLVQFFADKSSVIRNRRKIFSSGIIAFTCALSFIGFSNMVSAVYPIIGYASLVFLMFMVVRYIRMIRERRPEKQ